MTREIASVPGNITLQRCLETADPVSCSQIVRAADGSLTVAARFLGRTSFDNNSAQELLQFQEEGFFDPVVAHIPSYSYLDLSGMWTARPRLEIRAGVDNVLDRDPPFLPAIDISGAAGSINTFPTYDLVGREIFLAVRATL